MAAVAPVGCDNRCAHRPSYVSLSLLSDELRLLRLFELGLGSVRDRRRGGCELVSTSAFPLRKRRFRKLIFSNETPYNFRRKAYVGPACPSGALHQGGGRALRAHLIACRSCQPSWPNKLSRCACCSSLGERFPGHLMPFVGGRCVAASAAPWQVLRAANAHAGPE